MYVDVLPPTGTTAESLPTKPTDQLIVAPTGELVVASDAVSDCHDQDELYEGEVTAQIEFTRALYAGNAPEMTRQLDQLLSEGRYNEYRSLRTQWANADPWNSTISMASLAMQQSGTGIWTGMSSLWIQQELIDLGLRIYPRANSDGARMWIDRSSQLAEQGLKLTHIKPASENRLCNPHVNKYEDIYLTPGLHMLAFSNATSENAAELTADVVNHFREYKIDPKDDVRAIDLVGRLMRDVPALRRMAACILLRVEGYAPPLGNTCQKAETKNDGPKPAKVPDAETSLV